MKNVCFELVLNTASINKITVFEGEVIYLYVTNENKQFLLSTIEKQDTLINVTTQYQNFDYIFSKRTVEDYLLKNAPSLKEKVEDIISKSKIPSQNMKMKALYGGLGKRMALNVWIAFSKRNFIIVDLMGMSPMNMYLNTLQVLYNISENQKSKSALVLNVVQTYEDEKVIVLDEAILKNMYQID